MPQAICQRRADYDQAGKFLAISAAIIIAYGAWNSFMYSKALNAPDEINLPDVVERLGSIDKEMK